MKKYNIIVLIIVCLCLINSEIIGDCPKSDLTGDCRVDLADFAVMASQWLLEGVPEDPNVMVWIDIDDSGLV